MRGELTSYTCSIMTVAARIKEGSEDAAVSSALENLLNKVWEDSTPEMRQSMLEHLEAEHSEVLDQARALRII